MSAQRIADEITGDDGDSIHVFTRSWRANRATRGDAPDRSVQDPATIAAAANQRAAAPPAGVAASLLQTLRRTLQTLRITAGSAYRHRAHAHTRDSVPRRTRVSGRARARETRVRRPMRAGRGQALR